MSRLHEQSHAMPLRNAIARAPHNLHISRLQDCMATPQLNLLAMIRAGSLEILKLLREATVDSSGTILIDG